MKNLRNLQKTTVAFSILSNMEEIVTYYAIYGYWHEENLVYAEVAGEDFESIFTESTLQNMYERISRYFNGIASGLKSNSTMIAPTPNSLEIIRANFKAEDGYVISKHTINLKTYETTHTKLDDFDITNYELGPAKLGTFINRIRSHHLRFV